MSYRNPIVNDLLGVVGLYTIPTLTLDILTLVEGTTEQLYNPHAALWYHKTKYETRGATIHDHLVRASPAGWRLYYYIINNRQYGDVWILGSDKSGSKINSTYLLGSRVDFIRPVLFAFGLGRGKVLEIYDESGSNMVTNFTYPRRIIDSKIYACPTFDVAISLLEDGTVWYNNSVLAVEAQFTSIFGLSSFEISLITRDLQRHEFNWFDRHSPSLRVIGASGVIGAGPRDIFDKSVPVLGQDGLFHGGHPVESSVPIVKPIYSDRPIGIRLDGTSTSGVKLPEPVIYLFGEVVVRNWVGLSGKMYFETNRVPVKVPVTARIWQCGPSRLTPILVDGPVSAPVVKVNTANISLK